MTLPTIVQQLTQRTIDELIADWFGDRNSTLTAYERTTQTARMMEIDPALRGRDQRWQSYAVQRGVFGDGRSFDRVAAKPRRQTIGA